MMQWAENLCRVCGQVSDAYHLIHQKDLDIEFKLKKCLNLDAYKDDYKPKQICNVCYIKLNEFYQFIELCTLTNERFETVFLERPAWPSGDATNIIDYTQSEKISVIVNSKTVTDNLDCTDIDLYKDTMLPLDNLNVPSCTINDQEIIDIVENSGNYTQALEDNMSSFMDPTTYGGKQYTDEFYTQNSVVHSTDFIPDSSCSSNNAVLNYSYTDKPIDNQVVSNEINSQLLDNLDNQVIVDKRDCDNNLYFKYADNLQYASTCPNISLDYTNYEVVDKKQQEIAKEVENAVEKAKKLSRSQNLVSIDSIKDCVKIYCDSSKKKKARQNKDKELFQCPQCDKQFLRRITLNAHMAVHTKVRPFVCDICNKSFAIKYDLTNHQKVHTDEYKCRHCHKAFPVPSKLQRHIRTHTNYRPFVCNVKNCGKAFADKRNLDSHQSTHSDERKFKCNVCEKSYKTKNQLKDHSKAHSDQLQYKCEICGKAYRWKANLLTHKKKHTGYICPYCKKDCGKIAKLVKHRKECKTKCGLY